MIEVIAFQKDFELLLSRSVRSFIQEFNTKNKEKNLFLYPRFPLWGFANFKCGGENFFKGRTVKSAVLEEPCILKNKESGFYEFYFPLLVTDEKERQFNIIFAQSSFKEQEQFCLTEDLSGKLTFPKEIKSFRTGTADFKDNGWKLFEEKWIRVCGQSG